MIEQVIYGSPVAAAFPLFGEDVSSPDPQCAIAGQAPVQLRMAPVTVPLPTVAIPFHPAHGREVTLYSDCEFGPSAPGQAWCFSVTGVVNFHWQGGGNEITAEILESGNQELLVFWFVHILLPLFLTLERDFDFIHSAAVEVDEHPLLFLAPSTGGKSTLADYFMRQGHSILSDDKVATFLRDREYWAAPSHPYHRPFRQFEVLGVPIGRFAHQPLPVHAFLVLEALDDPAADILITEVEGFRKFEQLLPNYLYDFDFLRARRLRWLGELAGASRVYRVQRPWNLQRQGEVYRAILQQCLP